MMEMVFFSPPPSPPPLWQGPREKQRILYLFPSFLRRYRFALVRQFNYRSFLFVFFRCRGLFALVFFLLSDDSAIQRAFLREGKFKLPLHCSFPFFFPLFIWPRFRRFRRLQASSPPLQNGRGGARREAEPRTFLVFAPFCLSGHLTSCTPSNGLSLRGTSFVLVECEPFFSFSLFSSFSSPRSGA